MKLKLSERVKLKLSESVYNSDDLEILKKLYKYFFAKYLINGVDTTIDAKNIYAFDLEKICDFDETNIKSLINELNLDVDVNTMRNYLDKFFDLISDIRLYKDDNNFYLVLYTGRISGEAEGKIIDEIVKSRKKLYGFVTDNEKRYRVLCVENTFDNVCKYEDMNNKVQRIMNKAYNKKCNV